MPQTPAEILSELVTQERQQANLTQLQVAARLGKPQSFVSKYESGERRLDVLEFIQVARALSADPAVLFERLTALVTASEAVS